MDNFKIALCQMKVVEQKEENIKKAMYMIKKAYDGNADIAILPEMFNCPYENKYFKPYGEFIEENRVGETLNSLKQLSKELGIYVIAGSIPEIDKKGNVYNTSTVIDNKGNIIAKHRKIHLFDIDVKDGVRFKESDTLTAGDAITTFETPWGKLGLMICYDIRFPELSRIMALKGVKAIFTPAAFNMTTGPAHWETLFKGRALDNQIYMVGVSPARDENATYVAYGNSLVVNPWGKIIAKLNYEEDILFSEIDLNYENNIRDELPLLKHRREDIYIIKEN